jgi:hypothetical protein
MVRITPDRQRPPEPVQGEDHHGVPGPDVVQQRDQPGPVLAHAGQLVGKDPLAAGGGQRVVLGGQRLVVGADPGVAHGGHRGSVAELDGMTPLATPATGPTSEKVIFRPAPP